VPQSSAAPVVAANGKTRAARQTVRIGDRRLVVSNLEKILYPQAGFTKGQVLDYYAQVAPVLLPHLAGRPLTRKRYPNGVDGESFFEKNAPRGTPEWVRTVRIPTPGSTKNRDTIDFVVVDELATLIWVANLASLELHVPQWRVGHRGEALGPDLLVLDLDPGPPASIVECCRVAALLRAELADDGLAAYPKTSGKKGLQLYAPVRADSADETRGYARMLAQRLERRHRDLVVSDMSKQLRHGKVLVDWSQNAAAKTTVAPYSLRAQSTPTVSTPVSWEEVASCRAPEQLRFAAGEVLTRLERDGDLLADLVELPPSRRPRLPKLTALGGVK
jgi:bifunctional non-homologous end joining protein LigD